MRLNRLVLAVVMCMAALAAAAPAAQSRATTIADAWRQLPKVKGHGCGEQDLVFDYETGGGMRNFFCRALTVFGWKTFLGLAPVQPFQSGPHQAGKLNLRSEKQFGRYNPEFVRWAATALVPAANDSALREQTQKVYETQVRPLARTYWATWRVLASSPAWVADERRRYVAAMRAGQADPFGPVLDHYHATLDGLQMGWEGSDVNHVRSATAWWLRRYEDDTAPLWAEGLERLLRTYDARWLASFQQAPVPKPPRRAATEGATGADGTEPPSAD